MFTEELRVEDKDHQTLSEGDCRGASSRRRCREAREEEREGLRERVC